MTARQREAVIRALALAAAKGETWAATHIREVTEGLDRPVYYICGKPSMVGAMLSLLSGSGVPEEDMRMEVFRGYRG